VLSRSTEEYDRGDRFEDYRSMPPLQQFVLVSKFSRSAAVSTRGADGAWHSAFAGR